MSKYIKLEDAIEAVTSIFRVSALFSGINDNEDVWREKAEKVFAKCEVTDTAEQEPKRGKWIDRESCQVDEDAYDVAFCSECDKEITIDPLYDNYCPNCGAKNGE